MVKIGIIGGSGLDNPDILKDVKEVSVDTKFGKPSSSLKTGSIESVEVVILARHGRDHSIYPGGVNFRANIQSLKDVGCSHIIASTAVGSLREEIKPGHLVFIDQFIDHTKHRKLTFFEDKVVHTPMSDPFCSNLRNVLINSAESLNLEHHKKGTVITIEGPRFSTRAESHMFRAFGADIINMSSVPEASLAREAGICYASVAMSTDYDSWKDDEEPVTWEMIVSRMKDNADKVTNLIVNSIPKIKEGGCCK